MPKRKTPYAYWTVEKITAKALEYNQKSRFKEASNAAYRAAIKKGILEEVCSHMISPMKKHGYWTVQKLKEEALKYETRSEFVEKNWAAYVVAQRKSLLEEACHHMKAIGNGKDRYTYVFEFPNKRVYIGLTEDYNARFLSHMLYGPVSRELEFHSGTMIMFNILYSEEDARKEEELLRLKYLKKNWTLLSKNKTGGLGGKIRIWTRDKILKDSSRFKNMGDVRKYNPKLYDAIHRNKMAKEIFPEV